MNTNDILNGLNEAITAYHRVPQLEAEIKTLTEDRDFIKLERDEAERTIEALRAKIAELSDDLTQIKAELVRERADNRELSARNNELDRSVNDLLSQVGNANIVAEQRELVITTLKADKAALQSRLDDAKSFGDRLASILKNIGQSISSAVEVPEVTSDKPFPVDNTMGLSDGSSPSVDPITGPQPVEPVVEQAGEALVEQEVAAGCNPYRYW